MGRLVEELTTDTSANISRLMNHSTYSYASFQPIDSVSFRYIRNFTIGLFGLVVNMGAILVIMKAKKIKKSLRIYLTSLTINDFIFMMALTIPMWGVTSRDVRCTVQTLGAISPFAVSNIMTVLISFHNYQAVMNPLSFQTAQPTKRVVLTVVIVYSFGWSLSLMSVGSIIPQQDSCQPSIKLPKFVYILSATINAISVSCVLVLNMFVVYFLKSNRIKLTGSRETSRCSRSEKVITGSVVPASTHLLVSTGTNYTLNAVRSQTFCQNKNNNYDTSKCLVEVDFSNEFAEHFPVIGHQNNSKGEQMRFAFSCQSKYRQQIILPVILHTDSPLYNSHSQKSASHRCIQEIENSYTSPTCRLTSLPTHAAYRATLMRSQLQEHENRSMSFILKNESLNYAAEKCLDNSQLITSERNVGIKPISSLDVKLLSSSDVKSLSSSDVKSLSSSNVKSLSSSDVKHSKYPTSRSQRMKKMGTSLCIITLWCCFLYIPNLIYTMMSVSMETGRDQLDKSHFHMVGTTMVMINSLSNPFIYAWRFLDWSTVCLRRSM